MIISLGDRPRSDGQNSLQALMGALRFNRTTCRRLAEGLAVTREPDGSLCVRVYKGLTSAYAGTGREVSDFQMPLLRVENPPCPHGAMARLRCVQGVCLPPPDPEELPFTIDDREFCRLCEGLAEEYFRFQGLMWPEAVNRIDPFSRHLEGLLAGAA